ncbi:hypothetical protein, partial [Synechococcus sp. H55.10]|uniref:hypothetical protein n=1 Tax=Synechococcus sp. H55.10 TaxID=2964503 RepID=UPI0039C5DABD
LRVRPPLTVYFCRPRLAIARPPGPSPKGTALTPGPSPKGTALTPGPSPKGRGELEMVLRAAGANMHLVGTSPGRKDPRLLQLTWA